MSAADVELAEELARRSAVAIENAELFRALEQSERKFRVVTDTVPCAIYIHDGERLLYVNEAAVQLGGYSREELAEMSMFDLVHPDDRAMVKMRAAARLNGDEAPSRYEFRGIKKDGSVAWLDFAGSLVDYGGRRALLATAFDITERKAVEEKVQRSEIEARTLLNNIPDVVARYGPDLRYRYISPSVERLTGVPLLEFLGKTHSELGFPPELCDLFDNSLRKVLMTGKPDSIEFSLERDGETVYALGLGIPQFGPDGAVESVLTISRDVSDMRRATEAIRRSEKELRLLTDSLPALVAYVDKDQRLLRVNKTFEQWFGRPQESFYGKTLLEVMGRKNYQHVRANVERALAGGLVQYETTNQYVDRERHVLIAYVPDFDEQHQVRGFAALIQDLTERRQAQQALEQSEQRLRKFAEAGPAIFYSNLPNGYCDFVSQKFLEYTGLPQEQALGYGWLSVIHPEDAPRVQSQWERSALTGERNEDEFRFRRHDGTYRWFHAWNVPVRDEAGELVRWFGTTMDVDDQKQAEEALRKSEKLAAVGRLAASISHEINNPLEAVTNLLFLAKNDPELPKRARGYLTTAEQELARVSQIATQTLRFYRQSTRPTRTNLGELIDSVIALYEGRLSNAQISVDRRYGRDGEPLYAFEGELRQVLANLMGNAIDATGPNGRIVVKACRCRRWSTQEMGMRITIADTGHGIAPESRKRIFEPFFTTKKSTGTGLGLWVTREIVDKHQGYIRMRSSVERGCSGTAFMLFLPDIAVEASATSAMGS
jgi:PAS domain S-box-containing protein